jgi:hypothetical protein
MSGRSDYIQGHNENHEKCLHEGRWEIISAQLARIENKLDDHNKRLFLGNGTPALATTVSKHDQVLSALVWTTGTLVTSMIVAGVGLTIRAIFKGVS